MIYWFILKSLLSRESLIRHKNSETAKKQIELRREYAQKQEQLKVKLFQSVLGKIFEFKKTDAYLEYMKHCIEKADQFANGEDMTIYVDSTDQSLIETFQSYVDAPILVTDEHLIGGVRIVIPTKNVLIDESFFSKIEEEKHKFIF